MAYYDKINKFRKKAWGLSNRLSTEIKIAVSLGLAGSRDSDIIKEEDQMIKLLYKGGLASPLEDGKEVLQRLVNKKLYYTKDYYLVIQEFKNESERLYKLSTSYYDLGMAYM